MRDSTELVINEIKLAITHNIPEPQFVVSLIIIFLELLIVMKTVMKITGRKC